MTRREKYKIGRLRVWIVETKRNGIWETVRVFRGTDGPKVRKGQRVRLLKKGEIHDDLTHLRQHMSDEEIGDILGW